MDVMGMVAYNLESYADPRMSTNADVHQDPGRLERVLESIDDMKKNISNSHLYKMMITAKKFADSEDWYQLMEIAHELKTIQSPALLKDFMNASINTENVEAANEFWNLLIQMMPEKK
jgi:hypothetical protein